MKLLYIGCFVEPSQRDFIENRAMAAVTISATTFQNAFLSGFEDSSIKPEIINCPDIGSWPFRCRKIRIPSSTSVYHGMKCFNVPFFNITYIKRFSIEYSLKKAIDRWMSNNKDEQVVVVVYSVLYPYLRAALHAKQKYKKVNVCCIVLDLPEYFNDDNSFLTRLVPSDTEKLYKMVNQIDSFVLLTKYMTEPLTVGSRPWLLIEGIYAPMNRVSTNKVSKTILYTGKLDLRFGIRSLVDNFCKITDNDCQLWICGDGNERSYIEEKCKTDNRIKYFGRVKQEIVFEMQQQASLLINPRKPEGEYTKYSFPSKTMEYMASGTPVIMYRLPGLPIEYEDNLILLKDSSDEELVDTLSLWLNKTQEELDVIGYKAREFILNNKTSKYQTSRFINFINDIYGK